MKTASFMFLLLISFCAFGQQTDLTVAAGSTRTLTAEERTLSLKNLVLGDNCTIIIPPAMNGWTVTASDVTIGMNVKIIGVGSNGANAGMGANGFIGAACSPGANGGMGVNGGYGGPGKNVSLTLRIKQIGSLTINVRGGNGGAGGNGGQGGKGGTATCTCNGGKGGNGGNGGRGGNGGVGGMVTIKYSAIGNTVVSNSNFIIQNFGGSEGMRGAPGIGGLGGALTCTDPKALVKTAGANGASGLPGPTGIRGANGITTLEQQ